MRAELWTKKFGLIGNAGQAEKKCNRTSSTNSRSKQNWYYKQSYCGIKKSTVSILEKVVEDGDNRTNTIITSEQNWYYYHIVCEQERRLLVVLGKQTVTMV